LTERRAARWAGTYPGDAVQAGAAVPLNGLGSGNRARDSVLDIGRKELREKSRFPFTQILRGVALAATVLCGVLLSTPAQAYRTAGDLPEFEGTERVRWESA